MRTTIETRTTQIDGNNGVRLNVMPNIQVLGIAVLLAFAGTLQSGCTSSRVGPSPASAQEPAETTTQAGTAQSVRPGAHLVCPELSSLGVQSTRQPKGEHRVVLSWKASVSRDARHEAAIGYCVYRGVRANDPVPELVNSIPFPGTRCTDDSVENDKKYYYVAQAISAEGVTSIVSNEVPVTIPGGKRSHPSASGASVPLCREPASR